MDRLCLHKMTSYTVGFEIWVDVIAEDENEAVQLALEELGSNFSAHQADIKGIDNNGD